MGPKLKHLVIKPELRCIARCPTCAMRRSLHNRLRGRRLLTLGEWRDLLAEARRLGLRNLDISGGEPTLYRNLPELIRIGRRNGCIVQINSNGSHMPESTIGELADAGLDRVMISLYSHDAATHDRMRNVPGLWQKATAALAGWALQKDRKPGLEIIAQTLLCPENLLQLPDLLRLLRDLGTDGVVLSYLEGNFTDTEVIPIRFLKEFDERIRPELERLSRGFRWPVRVLASRRLRNLFSKKHQSEEGWATGFYHRLRPSCSTPNHMALVLANGEVHPCNVVEYAHEPVMGNVFDRSLSDIWHSALWNAFRKNRHPQCCRCPMPLQDFLPFVLPRLAVVKRRWI